LKIVFLTRVAPVDMALWDDTRIVPCDSQLYMGNTMHMEYIQEQLHATIGLEVYLDLR